MSVDTMNSRLNMQRFWQYQDVWLLHLLDAAELPQRRQHIETIHRECLVL